MNKTHYTVATTGANKITVFNAMSMSSILTINCNGEIVGSPNLNQDVVTVSTRDTSGRIYISTYRIPSGALICTIPVK